MPQATVFENLGNLLYYFVKGFDTFFFNTKYSILTQLH